MLRNIAATTIVTAALAILSACAPAGSPPTPTPPATPSSPQSSQEQAVSAAKKDLVQKKGLSAETITLVEASEVEWSDTSLGCPEPGMMYAQVITPGFRIMLSAGGETYEYHSDTAGSRVITCEKK